MTWVVGEVRCDGKEENFHALVDRICKGQEKKIKLFFLCMYGQIVCNFYVNHTSNC